MEHPGFFTNAGPFTLAHLASVTGSEVADPARKDRLAHDIRALADAAAEHISFVDNRKYLPQLETTLAGACFVAPQFANRVKPATAALVTKQPYRAFALALTAFYPEAGHTKVATTARDMVDPSAVLEEGVIIEPGAVVGPEARIGRGSRIAANAVVGFRCTIGRGCYIGPNASVTHALIGDRVILHAGVRIGQDGFGFALGPMGHLKVPQIGRVIIQDDVEIGANTSVDRGALKDTIIGEGAKIDNLVQIGHNVVIGRHCVIVGQVGISGSAELGDYAIMGGQSGLVGHIKVGAGAQIAGASHVKNDVPPGAIMAGTPARPFKEWAREVAAVNRLARGKGRSRSSPAKDDEEGI